MQTSPLFLNLVIVIISQIGHISTQALPEDAKLNTIQLATKYGHPAKQYSVTTEDKYNLTIFRLPGKGKIPILVTHGLLDSSDTWLLRGNTSLAITLANKGYDVWLANTRGNRYSRRHLYLNPDKDAAYWNFSFHEMGYFDLPAIIDTVLDVTGAKNLTAIGHSLGNTIYYVLGSERPEYNSKVNVIMALSPVAFLNNVGPPISIVISQSPIVSELVKTLGVNDLFGDTTETGQSIHGLCAIPIIGYTVCAGGYIFPTSGLDSTELEPNFFRIAISRFPAGISSKTALHYLQVGYRKSFAQYDYGNETNIKIYNLAEPPIYRLDKVTMPVALFAAANDGFSPLVDVAILRSKLANVVYYLLNPRSLCNHVDYMWGRTASNYLYPYIHHVLNLYNPL